MKKFVICMLAAMAMNFFAQAEEFTAWVNEEAKAAFCVYPQAFFDTDVGNIALERIKNQEEFAQVEEFQKKINADIAKDVSRFVVVLIDETDDNAWYAVIESTVDADKIEKSLADYKDFKAETVDGVRKITFTTEVNGEERQSYIALLAGKTVITTNPDILEVGIATVRGKAGNLADSELFKRAKITSGTALLEGAVQVDDKIREANPQAANLEDVVFTLAGLDSGKNELKVVATLKTEADAQQKSRELTGMKMIFGAMLPQLVEKIQISAQQNKLVVSLALDKTEIEEIIKVIKDTQSASQDEDDEDEGSEEE